MFPSIYSTFSYPTASDRLNNPSHSTLENLQSSTIGQLQAVIGLNGDSSTLGTLLGDLRSPGSGGGGHVQTPAYGGTGQTTYTKGDIIVATSPSVMTKLAVGLDGQAVVADSSVASGVKWGFPSASKVSASASVQTFLGSSNPSPAQSILSAVIPGSTLGTSSAIRATLNINDFRITGTNSIMLRANYGGGYLCSVVARATSAVINASVCGELKYTLISNNSALAQRGILFLNVFGQKGDPMTATSVISVSLYNMSISSVNSSANQTMGIEVMGSEVSNFNVDGYIVEKIV